VVSEDATGIWDIASGKPVAAFPPDLSFGWFDFTPDGQRVVTGNTGITLWNSETGERVARLSEKTEVRGLTLSPDGHWLGVSTRDHVKDRWQIEVWDVEKGELFRVVPVDDSINAMAFSADSAYLIVAREPLSELAVLNPRNGKYVANWPYNHNGAVWSLAVSPDGRWLVSCTSFGEFFVWQSVH